tara:strand:- start:2433 stop:2651 length:219 start_codon:yes stop_codon:yes gene_type:complete
MAKKFKYDINYLYKSYKKFYNKGNMAKAKEYNSIAEQVHGVSLDTAYHSKLDKQEKNKGSFGIGNTKKLKYG